MCENPFVSHRLVDGFLGSCSSDSDLGSFVKVAVGAFPKDGAAFSSDAKGVLMKRLGSFDIKAETPMPLATLTGLFSLLPA